MIIGILVLNSEHMLDYWLQVVVDDARWWGVYPDYHLASSISRYISSKLFKLSEISIFTLKPTCWLRGGLLILSLIWIICYWYQVVLGSSNNDAHILILRARWLGLSLRLRWACSLIISISRPNYRLLVEIGGKMFILLSILIFNMNPTCWVSVGLSILRVKWISCHLFQPIRWLVGWTSWASYWAWECGMSQHACMLRSWPTLHAQYEDPAQAQGKVVGAWWWGCVSNDIQLVGWIFIPHHHYQCAVVLMLLQVGFKVSFKVRVSTGIYPY